MDGRVEGSMEEWIDMGMDEWMGRSMEGWMDRWNDGIWSHPSSQEHRTHSFIHSPLTRLEQEPSLADSPSNPPATPTAIGLLFGDGGG